MNSNSGSSTHRSRRPLAEKKIRIKVVGVGGAGVNAIDRLVLDGFDEVSLLAINTDAQALASSVVTERLQIGENLTHGLGAGGDPQVGRYAAMEDIQQLRDLLEGYDLIFVAAGMGGGTGTGAGPIVAKVAREEGALVLGLITLPFTHEGKRRMEIAHEGFIAMQKAADAAICIPNDKLLALAGEKTSVLDAFRPTDEFLSNGVKKIWQMLTCTGLINIDFADLCSVLRRRNGETLFGFGEGTGEKKLEKAMEEALSSPLLTESEILAKAGSALVGVTHGPDFTMAELKRLMDSLHEKIGPQTACKQGIVVDENYADRLTIVVIASTGEPIKEEKTPKNLPKTETKLHEPEPVPVKPSEIPQVPEKPASMIKDTSLGLFADEPTPRKSLRKKVGAYEFIGDNPKQETLKLDEATRGLFERVERTMVNGEDLDRPTFIRRGIVLKKI
jgi:cell division protein FtsZ